MYMKFSIRKMTSGKTKKIRCRKQPTINIDKLIIYNNDRKIKRKG